MKFHRLGLLGLPGCLVWIPPRASLRPHHAGPRMPKSVRSVQRHIGLPPPCRSIVHRTQPRESSPSLPPRASGPQGAVAESFAAFRRPVPRQA